MAALLVVGLLAGCTPQEEKVKNHGQRSDPFGLLCAPICGYRAGVF